MDFFDYLEKELLLDEDFMDIGDIMEDEDSLSATACPMYNACPYVDECRVYEGYVSAVCYLMGGE